MIPRGTGERAHCWTMRGPTDTLNQMPTALVKYPDYEKAVGTLVRQHRKLRKERLHLAVYLAPPNRAKRDIYLFEVLDDFGGPHVDPEKKLFTFAYGSTPGFSLPEGARLWMTLTNPAELEIAIKEKWPRLGEIGKARRAGKAPFFTPTQKAKSSGIGSDDPPASMDAAGGI